LAWHLHSTGIAQVFATVEEVSGVVTVVLVDGSSAAALVGQKLLVGQTVANRPAC
jgi:hypothetical protein